MLPSVSTPMADRASAPRHGGEDCVHDARVFAVRRTAHEGEQLLRARAPAVDRPQGVLELLGNDRFRFRVDARRPDFDDGGEPVEVALGVRRCRGIARVRGRRRNVARRGGESDPRVARALVGAAAVDAQQVAGLVLLRLDAEHAALLPAQHLRQARRAQALPVLEVVALAQPQGGVEVHQDALGPALRRGQRARPLALERGELEQAGLEALVDAALHVALQRGFVRSPRARTEKKQ
jgi:hypothetical protein